MRRLTALGLAAPLLAALAVPLSAAADTALPACVTSGPLVCFTSQTHSSQVTVPAGSGDVTYADFAATVVNNGSSTVTHFSITDTPFQGAQVAAISGTDAAGRAASCSTTTRACSYGNLAAQGSVSIDVVLAVGASAVDGTNRLTLSLDEGTNDNPSNTGGKTDFADLDQSVALLPRDGSSDYSYVPAGLQTGVTLTTDRAGKAFAAASATEPEVGTTEISANLTAPVPAAVQRSTAAGPCPALQCAMTDWMQVSVPDFAGLSPAFLRSTVRVDAGLVATLKSDNPKTLSVYYRPDTATAFTTLPACTFTKAGTPVAPGCYSAIKEKDGDLTVSVYERHNGFIRL